MSVWWWLTSTALAAPFGWRWDGSAATQTSAPVAMVSPVWTAPLPATSNASVVVAGARICGTAEPVTLWCADAASGRLSWTRTNSWVDTLSGEARAAADQRMAAGEAAIQELGVVQAEYSKLQREARRLPDDTTIYTKLQELSAKMEKLKAAAADIEPYRTPSTRGLMGWASATPVTDGSAIYAVFSNGVVSRFDLLGNRQWSVWLGNTNQKMHGFDNGTTASPLLVDDLLIVPYGALHALDVSTGQIRWSNGTWLDYGSPAVARVGGAAALLTPDGRVVDARSGADLQSGLAGVWYTSPVVDGDMAFWVGSRQDAHISSAGGVTARAVRLSSSGGKVVATPAWSTSVPIAERFYAAPVVGAGVVVAVSQKSTIVALDRADGTERYRYDLTNLVSGEFWPNPVIAGGVLYVSTDLGDVLSVRAGPVYETLAVSKVGPMLATPAVAGNRMVFRTFKSLVAYGN
jgi:outer membrane protein assembly factor BamB